MENELFTADWVPSEIELLTSKDGKGGREATDDDGGVKVGRSSESG